MLIKKRQTSGALNTFGVVCALKTNTAECFYSFFVVCECLPLKRLLCIIPATVHYILALNNMMSLH